MDEQELFFEAVYADPTMSEADKVRWLHQSAKEYWERLEWAEKRYAMRDAEGSAWAEQATQNAAALAASEAARRRAEERERPLRTALEIIRGCESLACVRSLCDAALDLPAPSRPEPPAENDLLAIRDEANLALVAIADDGAGDAMRHIGNVVRIVGDMLGRPGTSGDGLREALEFLQADYFGFQRVMRTLIGRGAIRAEDVKYVEQFLHPPLASHESSDGPSKGSVLAEALRIIREHEVKIADDEKRLGYVLTSSYASRRDAAMRVWGLLSSLSTPTPPHPVASGDGLREAAEALAFTLHLHPDLLSSHMEEDLDALDAALAAAPVAEGRGAGEGEKQ